MATLEPLPACPCGSGKTYAHCCGLYLDQGATPHQAEALMRSRYTAYTQGRLDYLIKTWHPDTRPELDGEDLAKTQWLRLEVIRAKQGLKKALVEFNAYYREGDNERCLHEVSLFRKVKGRWVYWQAE